MASLMPFFQACFPGGPRLVCCQRSFSAPLVT